MSRRVRLRDRLHYDEAWEAASTTTIAESAREKGERRRTQTRRGGDTRFQFGPPAGVYLREEAPEQQPPGPSSEHALEAEPVAEAAAVAALLGAAARLDYPAELGVRVGDEAVGEREDAVRQVELLRRRELRALVEAFGAEVAVERGHEVWIQGQRILFEGLQEGVGHRAARLELLDRVGRGLGVLAAREELDVAARVRGHLLGRPAAAVDVVEREVEPRPRVTAVHDRGQPRALG
mmetsp:Transcript_19831/g.79021  ORF Transcript_19831/g.79021 Transcript_19831/m.79021 type:complete len:236 (-) Transcript_19831:859-1566(-)